MKKTKAVIWSGIEKFSFEFLHLTFGIIMARILSPSDYGIIGILMVFISFSNIFVEGGMTTAIIQKKKKHNCDYDTANIYNIAVAIIMYLLIFLISPWFENFYHIKDFTLLLRTLSMMLIISSLSAVYYTKLTIEYEFKKIFTTSISSLIISSGIGIYMALKGYGVWALVLQQLSTVSIRSILLITLSKYKNTFVFSTQSFHELFSFSYKLILTNIFARVYDNCYPLIVGKLYPLNVLGFYSRGQQFSLMPANILNDMFIRVAFPNMSEVQDDKEKLKECFILYLKYSSYAIFFIMFLVIILADPLIRIVLTDKWVKSIPFMQILCIGYMFNTICSLNLNLLFVKGRSDLALKVELIKKTTALIILAISTIWGIWGICIGQALYGFIATIQNTIYTKQYINMSYWDEFKIFGQIWIIGLISALIPYLVMFLSTNLFVKIFIPTILYMMFFAFIIKIICKRDYENIKKALINKISKK